MPSTRNNWRLKNLEKELQKADRQHIQEEEKKMEKSIDLGKLQNDLTKARALLIAATSEVDRAHTAYQKAINVLERASEKRKRAQTAVDSAKRSMVEAARAIATL